MASPARMIPLGYGKFVRADRIFAVVPLEGDERGDGRRTNVHVEGIAEAMLEDARAAGATSYVLGGDYAMFGPWPRETVLRLRELEPANWIRGNVDRWTANPADAPDDPVPQSAIVACREALGEELVEE